MTGPLTASSLLRQPPICNVLVAQVRDRYVENSAGVTYNGDSLQFKRPLSNRSEVRPGMTERTNFARFWAEFWAGATRPSLPALAGTIVVLFALTLLSVFGLDGRFIGGPGYGYVVSGPEDEYGFLAAEVQRFIHFPPEGESVIILGSSSLREAVTGSVGLSSLLRERTGMDVEVGNLAVGGLTLWEMMAVVDRLSEAVSGVVIFEISPNFLSDDRTSMARHAAGQRLPLYSPFLEEAVLEEGMDYPSRIGNYFLDNYRFFVSRPQSVLNAIRGPIQRRVHVAETWGTPTPAQWEAAVEQMGRWRTSYASNSEFALKILGKLVDRLRNRSLRVAFIEAVTNPDATERILSTEEARVAYGAYLVDIKRFASDAGIPYWDLQESADLAPEHFSDHSHIRIPGKRQEFTASLAELISEHFFSSTPEQSE